ncbi:MAG: Gfo/Idh/MocA family oxidoreductase [Anaerocolumna sp.]|jgi:predicted dehydrogenase|nr:Gfo/Idh/MocA family oxidoreductase [Anaerocolumna sp.]
MKLGIVGTGLIVREALPLFKEIENLECVALCGTSKSKAVVDELCGIYDIPYGVTDFEEMLKLNIDTVYIATPNYLHYNFCLSALNAGKNVIVEKPMTSNVTESEKLAILAREKGVFLFEAITTQYLENYQKIKKLLPLIGEVKLVQCNYSQYSRRYDAFREGNILPVFDPNKSGGALMDLNLYHIHYVVGLFGEPFNVEYYANIEHGIDTSGVLVMEYTTFQAVCIAAKDCAAPARIAIQGTKGYILQNSPANSCGEIILHLNDGSEQTFDKNNGRHRMMAEFENFINMIDNGKIKECNKMLDHSLSVSKVQTMARQKAGIYFPADDEI